MTVTDGWDWVGVPVTMSHDTARLLNAVAEAGDDDTPRLLLADELTESGKDDFGQFVRRQCDDLRKRAAESSDRPVVHPVTDFNIVGPRFTAEMLAANGPWNCIDWRRRISSEYDYNLATIDIASLSYRNRSASAYPRCRWHRGCMTSIQYASAYSLFRIVANGSHAWHPWNPYPEPKEQTSPTAGEPIDGTCYSWDRMLHGFNVHCQPLYESNATVDRHSFVISRYAQDRDGVAKWRVPGDWYHSLKPNSLSVVPEPIARFMTGRKQPRDSHPHRIYYPEYYDAVRDLNRAARLFFCEAAKQSRAILLAGRA